MLGVPPPHDLLLAAFGEPLGRVLADRLEQTVAHLGARRLGEDQRSVDERAEMREDVRGGELLSPACRLGRGERAAAGEDREPREQQPLGGLEQQIAPVDGGAQRLLMRQRGATRAAEQPEAVVEACRDLVRRQRGHARRGQLDGEGQPVEPRADLRDGGGIGVGHSKAGRGGGSALGEEPHRVARRKRRHARHGLAGHAEWLAAGGEHP